MVKQIKKIFVPDDHKEPSRLAEVLAIGEEVTKYKVGDKVLVSFYTGVPIFLPQYDLDPVIDKIATETEILGLVFEEEKEEYLPYGGI
jgi:co-chaperonin GroES (HSP10)